MPSHVAFVHNGSDQVIWIGLAHCDTVIPKMGVRAKYEHKRAVSSKQVWPCPVADQHRQTDRHQKVITKGPGWTTQTRDHHGSFATSKARKPSRPVIKAQREPAGRVARAERRRRKGNQFDGLGHEGNVTGQT